jgi:hypothetical protein
MKVLAPSSGSKITSGKSSKQPVRAVDFYQTTLRHFPENIKKIFCSFSELVNHTHTGKVETHITQALIRRGSCFLLKFPSYESDLDLN